MNPIMQRFAALLAGDHTTTGDELEAGAQLVVTDPDGSEVFRTALARHWRIDQEDEYLIWIRPILGGWSEHSVPYFNLSLARRRSLGYTTAERDGDDVVFHLHNDLTARVQPAAGDELAELRRWDIFTLNVLTATEETGLEELMADSWYGRFG